MGVPGPSEIGSRYNGLVIVDQFVRDKRSWVRCRCDCGGEITTRLSRIKQGTTRGCGCQKGQSQRTHGHAAGPACSPTYSSWNSMKGRCERETDPSWSQYGSRGIEVCKRWSNSFEAFLADMGERPPGTSLDRIDYDGNYTPENCRWATASQQNRNTRHNRILEHDGLSLCVSEWAEKTGLPYNTISRRLRRGWSVEKALSTPYLGRGGRLVDPVVLPSGETLRPDDAKRLKRIEYQNWIRCRNSGVEAERVDFIAVCAAQNWRCAITGENLDPCLKGPHPKSISLDHENGIANGGGHTLGNVRAVALAANLEKGRTVECRQSAKIKRLRRETGQQARRAAGKTPQIPQRANPWPPKGSRKLQSRGFQ